MASLKSYILITRCEHIETEDSLTGTFVTMRVDETMDYRIIISALEVIEPRLGVVVIVVIDDG